MTTGLWEMKEELKKHFKDERWGERYFRFLDAFAHKSADGIYEKHHILPRSMFPQYVESEWNIVKLTPRAHYIAHYILWKAVGNRVTLYAFNMMRRSSGNSYLYQTGKEEYRKYVRSMRWYYDVDSGSHVYTDGEPPEGYVSGYAFDTTPRKSLWAHDPSDKRAYRFELEEDIPDGFIRGRGKHGQTKHLNAEGSRRYLNLKTKNYEIVKDGAQEWFHVPIHGRRLSDFVVLVRDGVHYLTMASLPEHLKPVMKNGDGTIVPKPHWNATDDANMLRSVNHGKTYREAGIRVVQLQQCEFMETTEVRY